MTDEGRTDLGRVEAALPEQAPILANLLELYIHDFSEFLDLDIGEDGRFGYPSLSLYWSERGRYPFLIRANGKLTGFALVRKGSEVSGDSAVWDMAEFFVLRGCRGRGVGNQAADQVWRLFPGSWEVRVMRRNTGAQRFWARAISKFAGEAVRPSLIERNGEPWDLFSFHSRQVTLDSHTEDSNR